MVKYYNKEIKEGDIVPHTDIKFSFDLAYSYYKDYKIMSINKTAEKHSVDKRDMYYYMVAFRSNKKLKIGGKPYPNIETIGDKVDADRANNKDSKE